MDVYTACHTQLFYSFAKPLPPSLHNYPANSFPTLLAQLSKEFRMNKHALAQLVGGRMCERGVACESQIVKKRRSVVQNPSEPARSRSMDSLGARPCARGLLGGRLCPKSGRWSCRPAPVSTRLCFTMVSEGIPRATEQNTRLFDTLRATCFITRLFLRNFAQRVFTVFPFRWPCNWCSRQYSILMWESVSVL